MEQEVLTFGSEAEYKAFVTGIVLGARGTPANPINIVTTEANESNGWKVLIEHIAPLNIGNIFPLPTAGGVATNAIAGEQGRRGIIR